MLAAGHGRLPGDPALGRAHDDRLGRGLLRRRGRVGELRHGLQRELPRWAGLLGHQPHCTQLDQRGLGPVRPHAEGRQRGGQLRLEDLQVLELHRGRFLHARDHHHLRLATVDGRPERPGQRQRRLHHLPHPLGVGKRPRRRPGPVLLPRGPRRGCRDQPGLQLRVDHRQLAGHPRRLSGLGHDLLLARLHLRRDDGDRTQLGVGVQNRLPALGRVAGRPGQRVGPAQPHPQPLGVGQRPRRQPGPVLLPPRPWLGRGDQRHLQLGVDHRLLGRAPGQPAVVEHDLLLARLHLRRHLADQPNGYLVFHGNQRSASSASDHLAHRRSGPHNDQPQLHGQLRGRPQRRRGAVPLPGGHRRGRRLGQAGYLPLGLVAELDPTVGDVRGRRDLLLDRAGPGSLRLRQRLEHPLPLQDRLPARGPLDPALRRPGPRGSQPLQRQPGAVGGRTLVRHRRRPGGRQLRLQLPGARLPRAVGQLLPGRQQSRRMGPERAPTHPPPRSPGELQLGHPRPRPRAGPRRARPGALCRGVDGGHSGARGSRQPVVLRLQLRRRHEDRGQRQRGPQRRRRPDRRFVRHTDLDLLDADQGDLCPEHRGRLRAPADPQAHRDQPLRHPHGLAVPRHPEPARRMVPHRRLLRPGGLQRPAPAERLHHRCGGLLGGRPPLQLHRQRLAAPHRGELDPFPAPPPTAPGRCWATTATCTASASRASSPRSALRRTICTPGRPSTPTPAPTTTASPGWPRSPMPPGGR